MAPQIRPRPFPRTAVTVHF